MCRREKIHISDFSIFELANNNDVFSSRDCCIESKIRIIGLNQHRRGRHGHNVNVRQANKRFFKTKAKIAISLNPFWSHLPKKIASACGAL